MRRDAQIIASAPGSIMITGEHAVVYGHRAIVAAVEQRITVTLTPREDNALRLRSEIAPPHKGDLQNPGQSDAYRFVLAAIAAYRARLSNGFEMDITSQINPHLGLGSSAAVTIACLGALARLTGAPLEPLHDEALSIIRRLQGRGSGADLAASLHGGMIAYRAPPDSEIIRLPDAPELSLKYVGYKTPTSEVLRLIAQNMAADPERFDGLYREMGREADVAIQAAQRRDWAAFGLSLTRYQSHMEDLGVCDEPLGQIIGKARQDGSVLAAKISGSGLGDCVLCLGAVPQGFAPAHLARKGLIFHD